MPNLEDLLTILNPAQRQAVEHAEGAAMVLAGAGSGKTRVLTTRAAFLLNPPASHQSLDPEHKPLQPENILLVTFTNKAATEMNKRLETMIGHTLPWSGTFHRICARILRRDGYLIGMSPNYTIYDSDDQMSLIKTIYKKNGYSIKEYHPQAIKSAISSAKNAMVTPAEYEQAARGPFQIFAANVYRLYQDALREQAAVDFDDLMLLTVRLLQSQPELRDRYQQQFQHVLVDEYQDTNKVQYELTKIFTRPHDNVFVVGDFAQSIYAWRGADFRNMMNLKRDFPHLKEYKLEQNYRSTQTILDAATHVISENTEHPVLKLWTEQPYASPIQVLETRSSEDEARQVMHQITHNLSSYSYDDIAILYRTNAQSRAFEEAAVRLGIPYRLIGGFKFYERKEIKDVLSYLRLFLNPKDEVSRHRAEKIGKRRLVAFEQAVAKLQATTSAPTKQESTSTLEQTTQLTPAELLNHIIEATAYRDLFDPRDEDDATRLENIQELLNVATQFQDLATFLENIALVQDNEFADATNTAGGAQQSQNQPALTLMSLHSAKGLEFPVVFMVGMEEGLLPHSRSLMDKSQLEEERRLCYVGITRAKERLFLTYARERQGWGGGGSYAVKSRFLAHIPEHLIELSALPEQSHWSDYGSRSKQNWGATNSYQQKPPTPPPAQGRRVVVDDDDFEAMLNGEMDMDTFLRS